MRVDKDPQAILDYSVDWSKWLRSDTILTSTWTATSGLSIDVVRHTTTTTTAVVSGGQLGNFYDLINHIVTAAGLEDDRTIRIYIVQK